MTSSVRLEAGPLRVTFERCGDRYGHLVEWAETDNVTAELQSIEGTPDEDWPASPALKELHRADRPDGKQLALLVGMAGRSHWSLSVELDPLAQRLVFDVACRLREEPMQLGSAYRIAGIPAQFVANPPRLLLPQDLQLQAQPIENLAADLAMPSSDTVAIHAHVGSGKWPRTVRWRYMIGAADGP